MSARRVVTVARVLSVDIIADVFHPVTLVLQHEDLALDIQAAPSLDGDLTSSCGAGPTRR